MSDPSVRRKGSSAESIKRIRSEHERNVHFEAKTSSPDFQLRHGHGPSSNIIGVLKELKDDIVDGNQVSNNTGRSQIVSQRGTASGMSDVYIEQNGKFIKAPKELLENFDFNTRDVYLEEIGSGFSTPLDMAIIVEKAFSTLSRILLGILAGASLLACILIVMLFDSGHIENIIAAWPFLAIMSEVCRTLFYVTLTICLVSIFDWLDLAHIDSQHMVDTLNRRKIVFVMIIYLCAMAAFLIAAPSNDYIIHNMLKMPNATQLGNDQTGTVTKLKEDFLQFENLSFWRTVTSIYLLLCIIGWLLVTVTNNEDLFYIHLLGLKKYESGDSQLAFQNMAYGPFGH